MGYLHYLVQELPYISLRPMDDGRDKKAFLSVYAAKRLFLVGIHDVHAVLLRFSPSLLRFLFLSVFLQSVQRTAEFAGRDFNFVASGSSTTLLMANTYQCNLSGTR